jgi:hypothetical protein
MSKIEDITRYLRDLDKVASGLEVAEKNAVGIFLANPDTHKLPSMDALHGQILTIRRSVEHAVVRAEFKLKLAIAREGSSET